MLHFLDAPVGSRLTGLAGTRVYPGWLPRHDLAVYTSKLRQRTISNALISVEYVCPLLMLVRSSWFTNKRLPCSPQKHCVQMCLGNDFHWTDEGQRWTGAHDFLIIRGLFGEKLC